jgi:uncharacterized membrane-anchored protein YjiN (DUF445 family)
MVMSINVPSLGGMNSSGEIVDAGDVARLRRMKRTATGFLTAAAALYVVTFFIHGGGGGVLGFVRAGAEAAMVGGLADWFAVTALFRRPLHLPIPHTAIIPQQKDEIATKLGGFVTANFLTPELMTSHLAQAHLVPKIGVRLREPVYADRLGAEVSHALAVALEEIDTESVVRLAFELARQDLARRSYAPVLGELLAKIVDRDAQRPWVEFVTTALRDYIRDNRLMLRPQIRELIEDRGRLAWLLITDKRTDRLIDAALHELDEVDGDPQHPARQLIDGLLRSLATNLETSGAIAAKVDEMARHMLEDDSYQEPFRRFLDDGVASVRTLLEAADSATAARVSRFIQSIGHRIATDPEFEAMLEAWLLRVVVYGVREYGGEVTVLIQRTVAGWDPTSASRRIEVAVGRDLQFIRINGTVVGAMAGLAIHTITLALPS